MAKLILYRELDGTVPLLDWFDGLNAKALAKCRARIERLEELGHELRRPEADYLRDDIYELRIGLQRINYRILYFFHGKDVVVLSHGITKKDVVPPKHIDLAVQRKMAFEQSPDQHTYEEEAEDQ